MASFVFPPEEQLSEVTLALAANLATYKVRLLQTSVPLSPVPTLATLATNEANFTGYAAVSETVPPVPYPDLVQGGCAWTSPNVNFAVGASPTVGNQIYGFWVEYPDSGPTGLYLVALFNQPVAMIDALDQLNLQFSLNYFGSEGLIVTVNGQPK
jgi:hypothetical protein